MGSDAVLRAAVKQGVETGLRNALKTLKFDAGSSSEVRVAIVKEAVDAGVTDALKEANLYYDYVPVITEEQKFIKLAVKEGFSEALNEMEKRRSGQEPLQKNVFETAVDGLKRDLELKVKTALQELKDGSDEKFIAAMDRFTETLNVFMDTHKDMFSVDEEGGEADRTNSTKEGGEADGTNTTKEGGEADGTNTTKERAEADGTNTTKRVKSKFDLFVEKYNKDSLEIHRVLVKLVDKQSDIVDDWYIQMAEKFLDETWMQRWRTIKAVVPHLAKIYFYYLVVKMMRQSGVPVWKYPAVARAGRLLMSQKVLEVFEESEKKNGQKPGDDSKNLWPKVLDFFKKDGKIPGEGGKIPGEDEPEDD